MVRINLIKKEGDVIKVNILKSIKNGTNHIVKRRKAIGIVVMLSYAILCSYFYIYQDQLLFNRSLVPSTHPKELQQYEFTWNYDAINHHGWFIHGSENKPLIVYFGGNAEIISETLIKYKNKFKGQYDILAIEHRGFGSSEGHPSEKSLINDGVELLKEWMVKYNYDAKNIVIIGRSLGSGIAIQVAHVIKPAGIVLITPFYSINAIGNLYYPYLPINCLNNHPFLSNIIAPHINIPGLVIIANEDTVVPPEQGLELAGLMQKKPTILSLTATHSNIYKKPLFWKGLKLFLKEIFV